jgi:hypothetical protein
MLKFKGCLFNKDFATYFMSAFIGSTKMPQGFQSGQMDQTVNLTRKLRWFESTPLHHICFIDLAAAFMSNSRVWYNGRTSAFQADDAGSIPATRSS